MIFFTKVLIYVVLLQISARNVLSEVSSKSDSTPVPIEPNTKESSPEKDSKDPKNGRRTFFVGDPIEVGSSASSSSHHESHKQESSSFSSHKHVSSSVVGNELKNVVVIPPVVNAGNSIVTGSHSSSSHSHSHRHSSHSHSHRHHSHSSSIVRGSGQDVGSFDSSVLNNGQVVSGLQIEGGSNSASSQSSSAVQEGSSNVQPSLIILPGNSDSALIYDSKNTQESSSHGRSMSQNVNRACGNPGTPCQIVILPEIVNIIPGGSRQINNGFDSSAFDSSSQINSQVNGLVSQDRPTIVVQPGFSRSRHNNVVESYVNSGSSQSQTGSQSNGVMYGCGQNLQINVNVPCQQPAQNGPSIVIQSGTSGQYNGGQSSQVSESSQDTRDFNVNGIITGDIIRPGFPGSLDVSKNQIVQNGFDAGQSSVGEYKGYSNQVTGQGVMNILVPGRIISLPARPRARPIFLRGYNPNLRYYMHLIKKLFDKSHIRVGEIQNAPSFINSFESGQYLTESQLENYRDYLVKTGLIKMAPYKLIFSDKYKLKLPTIQWTVIDIQPNSMNNLYQRNAIFSSFGKLPLKLLVPAMQVRRGFHQTWSGASSITSGAGGIGMAAFRSLKDTPSHVLDLLNGDKNSKENPKPNSNDVTDRNSDGATKVNETANQNSKESES